MATSKKATHLKSLPARNDRKDKEEDGVGKLFSGKVSGRATKARKQTKKRKPVDSLPEELKELGDVFAAGKKVHKELDFKVRHAEYQVKDYCVRRFCENYLSTGHRPPSIEYRGDKSHFTFIQTSRINLTPDKVEALKLMNVAIDDHTELKGIEINSHAIQEHGLEQKLRAALEYMGVSSAVLEECFVPKVQLKDTFFDHLDDVVKESIGKGEDPSDKLYEMVKILGPANQVKNPDCPELTPEECFELVEKSQISLIDIEDKEAA